MAWKLSVVEMAPDFSRGMQFAHTFNGTRAGGSSTIPISSDAAQLNWIDGDTIKLGPSTHADNPGSFEHRRVTLVTSSLVYLSEPITYSYSNGDPIVGVGSGTPEGWYVVPAATISPLKMYGLTGKQGSSGTPVKGFNSPTSWQMVRGSGMTSNTSFFFTPHRSILHNLMYRLGGYYKQTGVGGTAAVLRVETGGSLLTYTFSSNQSSWTNFSSSGTLIHSMTAQPYIRLVLYANSTATLFGLDCIYLTHASLVNGASNGVYSIPVDPISVQEIEKGYGKSSFMKFGEGFDISSLNSQTSRSVRLRFIDADVTFLKNLEVFSYWQNLGYMLMLEPEAIDNLRPIFGYIDFNHTFVHWDENRLSIDLVFKGIR